MEVPGNDVPTATGCVLRFASGAVGTISSTRVLGRRHRVGVQLVGDGTVVELRRRSVSDHELRVTGADGERVFASDEDPIEAEYREFLVVLRGATAEVRVPYDEAFRTHTLVWAADTSAREGLPVQLPGG